MISRERVHAALRREPVDRPPVFMWFHPDTAVRFGEILEIPAGNVSEAMGDDVRQAWVNNNYAMEGITHEHDGEGHTDVWGIEWEKQGPFNQIRHSPLEGASAEKVRAYTFPYDRVDELMHNMDPVVAEADTYFIGADVSPCLFEMVCRLRGMEDAILELAADPELSRVLLKGCGAFAGRLAEVACSTLPLDWLWTGDDIGGQHGMIMSPKSWREIIKPLLKPIFDIGKAHDLWVAYHSCGSIRPIIGDLVEIGLDVLNPIQSNCPGMDPVELKKEFGADLAFMGGVDTQDLLPNGTKEEVLRYTEHLLEVMTADGGGYILAASHTIPPETPPENVFALYQAAGITKEEILDRAAGIRSTL